MYASVAAQPDSFVYGFSADESICVVFVSMPLLPMIETAETGHAISPRLAAAFLEERAIGKTVAQREHKTVLAVDALYGGIGVPVAELVAHTQAELVGIRRLQIVVDDVDLPLPVVVPANIACNVAKSMNAGS